MSKTIKQIADELGVSKQAVQKRLSREPLYTSIQPYVYTENGVKYIEVVGENLVKSAFLKKGIDKTDNLSIDKSNLSIDKNGLYTPIIEVLQSTINTLQGQLAAKDEQLKSQQKQISALQSELERERQHARNQADKLAVLADQAQQLHAATTIKQLPDNQIPKKHWWQRRRKEQTEE